MSPLSPPAGPVLALCGWSGSGKTTLLTRVIPRLARRGLAVCALKHDAHGIRYDRRGKDSDRLFEAGADVALRGPGETLVRRRRPPAAEADGDLFATLTALLSEYDVVIVEGHKDTPLPKVWLGNADTADVPDGVESVLATLPWDSDREDALLALIDEWLPKAWREARIHAGILIGGASRRMGRPKQLLELEGRSFLERTVAALAPHADEVVLLGSGPVPAPCEDLPRLPDPPGLAGPLAGILGAMRWAPAGAWILAGCDQPMIRADAVRWLLDQRAPGRWAILPRLGEAGVEPLLAIYDARARGLLEGLAAAGRLAPSALTGHGRVHSPAPPTDLEAAWRNVNTPEDLDRLA